MCRIESQVHPHVAGSGVVIARHEREVAVLTSTDVLPDTVTAASSVLVFSKRSGGQEVVKTGHSARLYHIGRLAIVLCTANDDSLAPVPVVPFEDRASDAHSPVNLLFHYGGSRTLRVTPSSGAGVGSVRPGASGAPCVRFVGLLDRVLPWCTGVAVGDAGEATVASAAATVLEAASGKRAKRKGPVGDRARMLEFVKAVRRLLVMRSYVARDSGSAADRKMRESSMDAAAGAVGLAPGPAVGRGGGAQSDAASFAAALLAPLRTSS